MAAPQRGTAPQTAAGRRIDRTPNAAANSNPGGAALTTADLLPMIQLMARAYVAELVKNAQ